uniref:COMM domain-containing protein n=1 Tax=Phaeomonas parva TaxID=124430 RepID=A0A7S1UFS0_9STRA|mmetsp:Transcript_46163/g.144394  ORF Transcript_46163/g.144394 Transcript_46163/m.144394 type:complete len:243 (+) Transcript_46163:163-891(+)
MRFRFCGDLDAPDWLLAEIATLSRISSVRMKLLVKQVMRFVATGDMDHEKVLKLTKDTLYVDDGASDLKGALAALDFIITSAAKYNVEDSTLLQEVQQLGLPKENSEALSRQYRAAREELRERLAARSYRVNKLVGLDWRVDYVMASSADEAGGEAASEGPLVHVKWTLDRRPFEPKPPGGGDADDDAAEDAEGADASRPLSAVRADGDRVVDAAMEMSVERFTVLFRELRQARELMRSVER